MTRTKQHIFEPSGCFTREAFEALVNGTLPPDSMALAKEHLQSCPFCSDATDGFKNEENNADFAETMALADGSFDQLMAKKTSTRKEKRVLWATVAIAASVLFLLGLFNLLHRPEPKTQLAENIAKDPSPEIKPTEPTKASPEVAKKKMDVAELATQTNAPKSAQKTVHFTPPVVTNENSRSEGMANAISAMDEIKQEVASTAPVVELSKTAEKESTDAEYKQEEAKGLSADKAVFATESSDKKSKARSLAVSKAAIPEQSQPASLVEPMPEFPGGNEALSKFISKNLRYPSVAREMAISGRVYVQFMVDTKGKLSNIKVLRGLGSGCDEEAIRVVKLMPYWKPASRQGQPVTSYFTLPIAFNMENK
jgi:TonB family protein